MTNRTGIDIRRPLLLLTAWLMLLIFALPAHSAEVLVIGNSRLKPVADVINSIRETMTAEIAVRSVEDAKEGLERRVTEEGVLAVIALGKDAVIYASSLPESVPIVYGLVIDPIETERKNITGVYMSTPVDKYINFINKNFPEIKKVGIICHAGKDEHTEHKTVKPDVVFHRAENSYEFIDGLNTLAGDIDALLLLPERELITSRAIRELYLFSFKEKVPVIGISEKYVKIGSLFSLGFDISDMGIQIGETASRVLAKGTAAGIPASPPAKLDLYINTKTSETMRVNVPDKLLRTAKKVYP